MAIYGRRLLNSLTVRNLKCRQRRQELLGSHRDGDQALDQVHDRVGAALLAQEIVRVVDDARCPMPCPSSHGSG